MSAHPADACTVCGSKTQVITTRGGIDERAPTFTPEGIRRRRQCLNCGHRHTTTEIRLDEYRGLIGAQDLQSARDKMTLRQPLHHTRPGFPLTPRSWAVTTEVGTVRTTHQMEATTAAIAIQGALELAGAGAVLVACLRQGEW